MTILQRKLGFLKNYKLYCLSYVSESSDLYGNVQTLTCEEILLSVTLVVSFIPDFPPTPNPHPSHAEQHVVS